MLRTPGRRPARLVSVRPHAGTLVLAATLAACSAGDIVNGESRPAATAGAGGRAAGSAGSGGHAAGDGAVGGAAPRSAAGEDGSRSSTGGTAGTIGGQAGSTGAAAGHAGAAAGAAGTIGGRGGAAGAPATGGAAGTSAAGAAGTTAGGAAGTAPAGSSGAGSGGAPPAPSGELISWDAFDYAPGTDAYNDRNPPLAGGDGWRVGWQVGEQMGSGFWGIDAASPLTFANLRTTGHYLNHRASDIGRQIGLTGGWSASVQGNLIGKPGLVVWLSALVRIDADAPPNPIFLTLHADAGFGYHYYNSAAQVTNWIAGVFPAAGVNQWSLWDGQHIPDRYKAMTSSGVAEIRAAAHPSAKSFVVGKTNLVVVKVEFAAGGDRVSLYIDPPSLGGAPPAQPDATLTASGPAAFCAFAFAGGDDSDRSHPQACALDEVRIGTTFAAVTPTQ